MFLHWQCNSWTYSITFLKLITWISSCLFSTDIIILTVCFFLYFQVIIFLWIIIRVSDWVITWKWIYKYKIKTGFSFVFNLNSKKYWQFINIWYLQILFLTLFSDGVYSPIQFLIVNMTSSLFKTTSFSPCFNNNQNVKFSFLRFVFVDNQSFY